MKQKLFRLMLAVLAILLVGNIHLQAKKVHTIGDSTQEQRATDGSTDKRGWTQMLPQFIDASKLTVNNRGKSGASSKSFYKEKGYWNTLVTGGSDQMQSGDLLIIQFAHNDEKTGGSDGDEVKAYYTEKGETAKATAVDYRGTTPFNTYKEYLRKYINEAKAMVNAAGQHNLYQNYNILKDGQYLENQKMATDDHSMDYTYQMSQVAAEYDDVPFVNLTQGTKELYEALGDEYCTAEVFCKDDGTHPALVGATLIARKFAQMVKDQAATESNAQKKAVLQELADAVLPELRRARMVINYDVPRDAEDYVHRIGRTARAENSGEAITLVSPEDAKYWGKIERFLQKEIQRLTLPSALGDAPDNSLYAPSERGAHKRSAQKHSHRRRANNGRMKRKPFVN